MVTWNDTSDPNNKIRMMDDMRTPNEGRRNQVSTLAAGLVGLTLEQVEGKLNKLDEGGYHAYCCTVNGDKRNFRVSKSDARGWDGVSFILPKDGVVQEANIY